MNCWINVWASPPYERRETTQKTEDFWVVGFKNLRKHEILIKKVACYSIALLKLGWYSRKQKAWGKNYTLRNCVIFTKYGIFSKMTKGFKKSYYVIINMFTVFPVFF